MEKIKDQIDTMSEIFNYILEFHPLDEVNNKICEIAAKMLSARASSIMLFETDEPDIMRIKASYGLSKGYVKIVSARVGVDLAGIAIQEKKSMSLENIPKYFKEKKDIKSLKWIKKEQLYSVISFPIFIGDKNYGALNFYFKESYKINKRDRMIMNFFVKLSAVAIKNNENILSLNENISRLTSLNEINKSIASTMDLDQLWEVIYKETSKFLETRNFEIAIYHKKSNIIDFVFVIEKNKKIKIKKRKFSNGFTEKIIKSKKPVLIPKFNEGIEKELGVNGIGESPRSWLGVPIMLENHPIGAIIVQDYEKENSYNETDKNMLLNIASQTAIAIKNGNLYKEIEALAIHDGLTKLYNSRYFYKMLAMEMKKVLRYGGNLLLTIVDLDDFKMINDKYGHIMGDKYLRELSRNMKKKLRSVDLLARYGGDEFVILSHNIDKNAQIVFCEKILNTVSDFKCEMESGASISISCSIGGIGFPYKKIKTEKELVKQADKALYKAKKTGKNQFVIK